MLCIARWVSGNKIYWGIKTGFNEAFIINAKQRDELVAADPQSAEIIKPLAIGDDVRKWHLRDKKRYLIFSRRGTVIEEYPAVLAHLQQFRQRLEPKPRDWDSSKEWLGRKAGSYKWYEIQDDVAYFKEFDKPKIIYPEISMSSRFCYDRSGKYLNNKAFIIPTDDKYLLGILSSEVVWTYLRNTCSAVQGNALELKSIYMTQIPIPIPTEELRNAVSNLVDRCLSADEQEYKQLQSLINELATTAYGL